LYLHNIYKFNANLLSSLKKKHQSVHVPVSFPVIAPLYINLCCVIIIGIVHKWMAQCRNQGLGSAYNRRNLVRVTLTRTLHDTSGCTINFGTNELVLLNITVTVTT